MMIQIVIVKQSFHAFAYLLFFFLLLINFLMFMLSINIKTKMNMFIYRRESKQIAISDNKFEFLTLLLN